jgi:hypothetical protein
MQQQELLSKLYQLRNAVFVWIYQREWFLNAISLTSSILQEILKLDVAFQVLITLQVETIQTWTESFKNLQTKVSTFWALWLVPVSVKVCTCPGCLTTDDTGLTLKQKSYRSVKYVHQPNKKYGI